MSVRLDVFRHPAGTEESRKAGDVIFAEGDPGEAMYVVLEGQVELRIRGKVVETLGPREPFGEMALIDQSPRVATAVAKTDCRLVAVAEKRFLTMVKQTPLFGLQMLRVLAHRLRKANIRG
jgi:CRP-like cAMP-binding protein